jgi:TetR/AcrR family transcriptional regulator
VRAIPDDMAVKVMAAADLFAERGLDGATMSDIAAATGIPRATLYYHFDGKEAVFACLCDQVFGEFEHAVAVALSEPGPAADRLDRVVHAQLTCYAAHPAAFLAIHLDLGRAVRRAEIGERAARAYLRPVAKLLKEGESDGSIHPVANPSAIAAALLGAVASAVALRPAGGQPVADLHEAMTMLVHSLDARQATPATQG